MYKYKTIKVDTVVFDRYGQDGGLKELLEAGWEIVDKSTLGERYIFYVLRISL
jgi:hypothetical protein